MGKWILRCPTGGEYEGECRYYVDKYSGRFILICETPLKKLKEPEASCDQEIELEHQP